MIDPSKKRPHESSPVIKRFTVEDDEKRALVSKLLHETNATYNLPKVTSDEELEQRIADYFQRCAETGEVPTVEQVAQCTGYSITTFWDWENGRNKGFSSNTSTVIKKAKEFIRVFDAKLLLAGAVNPVSYIFRAKNYYGMRDQVDHVVATPTMLEGVDQKSLEERYNSVPLDTIDSE